MSDAINPAHYGKGPYGCIKIIESLGLGFRLGNCFKYIYRAGEKPGADRVEDLEKALWYLQREIAALKAQREKREKEFDDNA